MQKREGKKFPYGEKLGKTQKSGNPARQQYPSIRYRGGSKMAFFGLFWDFFGIFGIFLDFLGYPPYPQGPLFAIFGVLVDPKGDPLTRKLDFFGFWGSHPKTKGPPFWQNGQMSFRSPIESDELRVSIQLA
jgi:hypothetical protein